jgi:enamine deaminase RidA (YjgF/YER057c/UK114 family)
MGAKKEFVKLGNFMEEVYGFAQAVKVGDTIHVAGQTAFMEDGSIDGPRDMATQMRRAYTNIAEVLGKLGATMDDVVEETLFVTDYMAAATVAKDVRKQFYGESFEVASNLIHIAGLGTPEMVIEIACVAKV